MSERTALPGANLARRRLRSRRDLTGLLVLAVLVAVPAAGAKDFGPGDLRACDARRCVPITNRGVLPALASFYYSGAQPPIARRPPLRAPYFELRFRNGYVTGIVASARVDRFLSYGVNSGRFQPGKWYEVSARVARELRRLTAGLRPFRLSQGAVEQSR